MPTIRAFIHPVAAVLLLVLVGCTQMDYRRTPTLTGKSGKASVVVVGVDDRNAEEAGIFKPYYVGLYRDLMAGIPYYVFNLKREPIADTLASNAAAGLVQSGYQARSIPNPEIEHPAAALAAARALSPSRILLIRVHKFESDSQIRTEFGYDLGFELYDAKGRLLASDRVHDLKMYGPSYPAVLFAKKNLPREISQALSNGISPLMKNL